MSKLIHSKKVRADHEEFLDQLSTATSASLSAAAKDTDQLHLFKCATATHTIFRGLAEVYSSKLLHAMGGIARRVAVLAAVRQVGLLRFELRRLIECTAWFVYFMDHPVEAEEFCDNPGGVFADFKQDPIAAGAHGPASFYRAYVTALLSGDPSGIGADAASELVRLYAALSSEVHPASIVVQPSATLSLASDRYDGVVAKQMAFETRQVMSACALVLFAAMPEGLSRLDAIDREWFDWLVGATIAKKIRGERFGVQRYRTGV